MDLAKAIELLKLSKDNILEVFHYTNTKELLKHNFINPAVSNLSNTTLDNLSELNDLISTVLLHFTIIHKIKSK